MYFVIVMTNSALQLFSFALRSPSSLFECLRKRMNSMQRLSLKSCLRSLSLTRGREQKRVQSICYIWLSLSLLCNDVFDLNVLRKNQFFPPRVHLKVDFIELVASCSTPWEWGERSLVSIELVMIHLTTFYVNGSVRVNVKETYLGLTFDLGMLARWENESIAFDFRVEVLVVCRWWE